MRAVHWLRSRQEEYELIYWLSFVAFDYRNRSLNNRIYLLYLIAFFGVWTFATLTLIASGGARLLQLLQPDSPQGAASLVEVLVMGSWSVFSLWQAQKRSPVVFSEVDATLVCQTPLDRRQVVLRWFPMPWLKSALPFWLGAVALGFAFAEVTLPGTLGANRIFEYTGYGVRAWLAILPIHLAIFALSWVVGIVLRQQDVERPRLAWPVIGGALALLAFLLAFAIHTPALVSPTWRGLAGLLLFPLQAGFGVGSLSSALLAGGLLAALALASMYAVSGRFSLSRAAQETRENDTIHAAMRYGLAAEARDLQTQQQLGVERPPTRLPDAVGAAALLWKDVLQSQRSFRLGALLEWLTSLGLVLSVPFLPDFGSRIFILAIWVLQIGKLAVTRLQSDLACWPVVRQLSISHGKLLLADLGLPYLLAVLLGWAGLLIGSLLSRTTVSGLALLLPAMAAGAVGMAAFDVLRRSRSSLLLNGSVPTVGAGGILLGWVVAAVPWLVYAVLPGIGGLALAIFLGVLLDELAYHLAVRAYHTLGDS